MLNVANNPLIVSVVMLSVIMLTVMAPWSKDHNTRLEI
jgi:hypothetical protein